MSVLALAFVVLLTSGIAVNGISAGAGVGDGSNSGFEPLFGQDNPNSDGNGSGPGEGSPSDEGGGTEGDGDTLGTPAEEEGDGSDNFSVLPGMLDSEESETSIPTSPGLSVRDRQLSADSFVSFVDNPRFFVDPESGEEVSKYWRTATRDTYNGTGISNTVANTSSQNPELPTEPPTDGMGKTTRMILNEQASQIPVDGDPVAISINRGAVPDRYTFRERPDGSVIVTDSNGEPTPLPRGTELQITTQPSQTSSGQEFIEKQYTTPNETATNDLGELNEHILYQSGNADSSDPEKTRAIVEWVKSNGDYKVNNRAASNERTVERFLFGSEGGSSLTFATATTELLRAQDIPARVAIGYQTNASNTSTDADGAVSSMDKHAWVEVYEDGQWVTYDPTPVERQEVIEKVKNGDQSTRDYGVHPDVIEEWDTDSETVNKETDDSIGFDQSDTAQLNPPYNITLTPDPTPGAEVTVTVSKNGTPISGASVMFNGETVGSTNYQGKLATQVPYTSSLTVSADPPDQDTGDQTTSLNDVQFDGASTAVLKRPQQTEQQMNSSETFELPTNVSIDSDRVVLPGESISLSFTVNDTAIPDVPIYIDGTRVGETDTDGEAEITVPESAPLGEPVLVSLSRDEFTSETELMIGDVEMRVETGLLPLPSTSASATVVASDGVHERTMENATMRVTKSDGDGNETVVNPSIQNGGSFTLPFAKSATVDSSVAGKTVSKTISGLFRNAGAVASVLLGLVITGTIVARRNETPSPGIAPKVVNALISVGGWVQRVVRSVGNIKTWCLSGYQWLSTRLTQIGHSIRNIGIISTVTQLLVGIGAFLVSLPGRLKQTLSNSFQNTVDSENPPNESDRGSASSDTDPQSAYERVRTCWRWVVRQSIGRVGTLSLTTVEIQQRAVSLGLPKGPIERLRRSFQQVEYGFTDAEMNVDDAESAVETLRNSTQEDDQ